MPVVVVDASVVAALLFGEAAAEKIVRQLGENDLAAPSLLPYEMASVASGKVRRGSASTDVAVMALNTFTHMRIALHEPDPIAVFRLAIRTGLTPYDAAYLWLARSLSADLVTLDRTLERAAARVQ